MAWFRRATAESKKPDAKEDIWAQCSSCKAFVFKEEWKKSLQVCPRCGHHERLGAWERIGMLVDEGSFTELNPRIGVSDPLKFSDAKGTYVEKAEQAREKTRLREAVVTGYGRIGGIKVVLAVMDFNFLGGSLGSGTGEKIFLAAEYAAKHHMPYIVVSASGGARMHEGIVSLMQMAKTSAALARLSQAGMPYISLLTDPTTGGVSASYAMLGDINLAEPKALVGFAGRRVIEQTIKQQLPDEFQTAEYVRDHGFVDLVVPRKELKDRLHKILQYCTGQKVN